MKPPDHQIKPLKLPPDSFAIRINSAARQHGPLNRRFPEMNCTRTAPLIGIGQSHFQAILNGKSRPSLAVANRMAKVIGVSVEVIEGFYHAKVKSTANGRGRAKTKRRPGQRSTPAPPQPN